MRRQRCTQLTATVVNRLLFLRAAIFATAAVFLTAAAVATEEPPEITHDGLHLVRDSQLAVVWAKPDIDLSVYNKILILELYVAFDSSWERDQGRRVSGNARNNIKQSVVAEFNAAFREELEVRGGYPIVAEPGEDVMIIRPRGRQLPRRNHRSRMPGGCRPRVRLTRSARLSFSPALSLNWLSPGL